MRVDPAFAAGSKNGLEVVASIWSNQTTISKIELAAGFKTFEEAEAFVTKFPKSCGLKATTIGGCDQGNGWVRCEIRFAKDGVNGGKNETGIKRFKSIVKNAEKLGVPLFAETRHYGSSQVLGIANILAGL